MYICRHVNMHVHTVLTWLYLCGATPVAGSRVL
jgi:hypothetical protein